MGIKKGNKKTPGAIDTTSLGVMELIARFELATSSLPIIFDCYLSCYIVLNYTDSNPL